jgi:lipid II:glycine glycyltransferase (peptidoglycan interpeptide bridge formation enzyme)
MNSLSSAQWTEFLAAHPGAHILQTAAWGELKAHFGWEVVRLKAAGSGAQILFRRLAPGFTFGYLPKGPVGHEWEPLWPIIDELCRERKAVFLKVEPDLWQEQAGDGEPAVPEGFRLSPQSIQPPRTLAVDISAPRDQVLARMKQKTRYNIRLARRKQVVVRPSADIAAFSNLMQVTAQRDEFGAHNRAYYQRAFDLFHARGECELLMAEYQGELLAGVMVFAHGPRAWYFYGASSDSHRNRMPAYLLQWEAICWAQKAGCLVYDLWGVPDEDLAQLEAGFTSRSDGLWGVYRFKRGFGGQLRRAGGPWDRVYRPAFYTLYRWWAARH